MICCPPAEVPLLRESSVVWQISTTALQETLAQTFVYSEAKTYKDLEVNTCLKAQFTQITHFLPYLWWYIAMPIVSFLFVLLYRHLPLRFLPAPKHNGGEWDFINGAHSIGKLQAASFQKHPQT